MAQNVTTYSVKQMLAVRVDDHVEIAVEAHDGAKLKLTAKPDQLEALVGDLETILDSGDKGGRTAA